jgi:hypothetical protein
MYDIVSLGYHRCRTGPYVELSLQSANGCVHQPTLLRWLDDEWEIAQCVQL